MNDEIRYIWNYIRVFAEIDDPNITMPVNTHDLYRLVQEIVKIAKLVDLDYVVSKDIDWELLLDIKNDSFCHYQPDYHYYDKQGKNNE